jgi:MYXO-CTERM domain-containing protein
MALARTRFQYTTDTSIQYISPTNGSNGIWYRFACVEGTPLCYRDEQNELDVWKNGTAGLHRRYRLTKINPGTLPRGVTHAPILVDYKMAHVIDGTYKQGGMTVPGLRSKTTVAFGHYESGANGKYVFRQSIVQGFGKLNSATCWGADGNFVDPTGRTCAGRFRRQVPIASGDALQLIATAELIIDSAPGCEMVDTPDGPQCLVKPWNASGHAISDPYVFIDPAWEYASWFKLEMSADETDSVWVTPERTHLDPETLTLLSDGGVPLADDGGVDRVDGGADGRDGGVDTGGDQDAAVGPGATSALDAGTTGGSGKQSGGGCQLASGNSPGSLWLLAGLLAVALRRRRRSARKRSA